MIFRLSYRRILQPPTSTAPASSPAFVTVSWTTGRDSPLPAYNFEPPDEGGDKMALRCVRDSSRQSGPEHNMSAELALATLTIN